MPIVRRREWYWVVTWTIVILIVANLPYLYGAMMAMPASEFGGFVIGLEDGFSYLAKMQQGRSGYWLFRLVYTPEPHQAELFFPFYILLGKLAGLTHLSNVLIFHLTRLVTIPLGLLVFYYFVAYFSEQIKIRRLAWLIFGFTGGLGWLWLMLGGTAGLGRMPVDLWVPDASFFLTALTYAHLPLAQSLLLGLSVTSLEFVHRAEVAIGIVAAVCGLLVSLIHPYTVPVFSLIMGLYILGQSYHERRLLVVRITRLVLIILPTLPYLLYVMIVFERNPAFVTWREQSLTYSPAPLYYLLGYGFTLVFAAIGWGLAWQATEPEYKVRFLQIWAVSVPVLVYLPIALQRRFLDGYQAPLAILAAGGLYWLVEKIRGRSWQTGILIFIVMGMSLTNILLVMGAMMTVGQRPYPVFIPAAEAAAGRWLAKQPQPTVVLASYQTGNYLPTVADVRTFVGHGPETMDSESKQEQVKAFFNETTDDRWRLTLLKRFDIRYVYYGPVEQSLGDFEPNHVPYLQEVYNGGTVRIYRMREGY